MKKIAIFASGSGTNAQNIIEYLNNKGIAKTEIILSNKKDSYVLERARQFDVPTVVFNRDEFYNSDTIPNLLDKYQVDLVILAGFLWLIPENLLKAYPNKIVNIHPALLPKYGGKGMYGAKVHESVVENKEEWTGITIHYINERYDEGDIIFQAKCKVEPSDNAETVAQKVHSLEYKHFPKIIEDILCR